VRVLALALLVVSLSYGEDVPIVYGPPSPSPEELKISEQMEIARVGGIPDTVDVAISYVTLDENGNEVSRSGDIQKWPLRMWVIYVKKVTEWDIAKYDEMGIVYIEINIAGYPI
jgi:hypothetical protein